MIFDCSSSYCSAASKCVRVGEEEELFQIKAVFYLPAASGDYLLHVLRLIQGSCVSLCSWCSKSKKIMNYSVDHPVNLLFSLWWQSALFRKLDWNVWGLIYRSRMNTWMWSSAIFHTHSRPRMEYYYRCPRKLRREPFFTWTSITVSCWTLFTMCRAVWHAVKYFLHWPQISAEVGQFPLQLRMYDEL